ncbi:MAG TPA: S8 family serine peptidase, partial [Pyrinomonadaceae bacterium]|nr:S8 family serine peptidase [Pyrinomonadaceae bacterium]
MSFSSVRSSSLITSVIILILFVCLLSLTSFSPRASLAAPQIEQPTFKKAKRSRAFVPGNVIVRYRDESTARIQQRQATQLRADNGEQLEIRVESLADASLVPGLRLAKVDPDRTLQAIVALKSHPDVIYAEPDYILQRDALPNDPSFGQLYGMTNIHAQQAWDTTTGSSSVVVGVIDEGIDINHQDLQANIWTNSGEIAGNGIDDDGNGFIDDVQGWNFIPCNLGDPVGCGSNQVYAGSGADAHGTHVAGTIGAVGNNGIGVVGVNWQVKIMPLKFLGPTDGTTSDAIRAYGYAKMMRDLWVNTGGTKGANLRVLNNSYGGDGFSQSQSDAINSLNSSGILFVAAAGNDGVNTDVSPHYPSSYDLPNLISVAATDSSDQISSFSNFGTSTVHMGAPGSNILSTTPNNTYSFFSGTSMATPHVAGAAALLLARFPNLTVQQLRGLLMFNGDDLASLATKTLTGRRLNVLNSLQSGAENDTTPPGTVTNLALTSQQGRTLSLQWTALGDDGASGRASLYDVSFVDSANPGAPIPLAKLKPNVSGTLQTVTVKIPFRHTSGNVRLREFDNVGNEGTPALLPVSISADISDPYVVSETAPPGTLSTGTPIGLNADDKYSENYPLPFSFPFYGQVYTSVTISTNGALYFSTPPKRGNGDADDVPSAVSGLNSQKMIAALWDDLRTDRRAGDDVYVTTPDLNRIIFRWQGVTFGNGTAATEFPVNFEVELRRDGSVITRYGSGNTNIFPVVGISGGEPDAYSVNSHTSETSPTVLTNAQTVNFALRTAPAPSNPIDDGRVFVRQQYLDFLGREPDQAGWDYWTGQIANCGTNQQCIHDQRIGVSA